MQEKNIHRQFELFVLQVCVCTQAAKSNASLESFVTTGMACRTMEFALAVYILHTNYEDIVLKSPQKHTNCCERHSET